MDWPVIGALFLNREGVIQMKVQADTITGVYEVEDFDAGVDVLDQEDFINSLDGLADGETIAAEISQRMETRIYELYGIR
jgi:hypothetical protein